MRHAGRTGSGRIGLRVDHLAVIGRLTTELNIERPDQGGGTRLRMCFANG